MRVYGRVGAGQPSSYVVMDMDVISVIDIGLSNQISGPPRGWRFAELSVAILWAIMKGQNRLPPL